MGAALLESTCRQNWRAASYSTPISVHHQSYENKCMESKSQGGSSGGRSPAAISYPLNCIQYLQKDYERDMIRSALPGLEKKNDEAERLVKCFAFIIINFFQKQSSFTRSLTQSLQTSK